MIRKFIMAAIAGSLVLGASACNTVKGLGKDIESAGEAGDEAINGK
ncbi:entericidin A/B family lipoprotein [Novosphingobium aquae]|uniref:Entericidin A/B family lipoprotein n=1 Tax=Novosphingobium aquae TaxID=3133435 RepID=A0ABU8S3S2_9SPHN